MRSFALAISFSVIASVAAAGPPAGDRAVDPELDKLIKKASSPQPYERLKAISDIGKKGEAAVAASAVVCNGLIDSNAATAVAARQALEKVNPTLYKPLSALMLDESYARKIEAADKLRLMGEAAAPATRVMLVRLRNALASRDYREDDLAVALSSSIRQVALNDKDVVQFFLLAASPTNPKGWSRTQAIGVVVEWAGDDRDRRKRVAPVLASNLTTPDSAGCIIHLGNYGDQAAAYLETIRKLKLSSVTAIREAAGIAVDKIEAAKVKP